MPPENSVHSTHPPLVSGRLAVWEWIALLTLFCLPPLVGMARHPLWIDEAQTLFPVATPSTTFVDFARSSLTLGGSLQVTPLYAILVALWARIFPTTELALRCVNLPFLVLTAVVARAYVWHLPLRTRAGRWWALALIGLSPFYVYYSFDLRPYASLICFGGMMGLGLVWIATWDRRGPWWFAFGFGLAFLSQPTVVVIAPLLGLLLVLLARRDLARSFQLWRRAWIVAFALCVPGGIFYYLVRHGSGAQSFGGRPDLKNVIFVLFEFAGFSGLGPTREQLRTLAPPEGAESMLSGVTLTWLDWWPVALAAGLWIVGLATLFWLARPRRDTASTSTSAFLLNAAFFVGGLLSVAIFFYFFRYRFLPRHICFLYLPFMFALLALAASARLRGSVRVFAPLAVLGFATSAGQLLLNPRYARDDFRSIFARWQEGRKVDPELRVWAFSYPPSFLYYAGAEKVLYLDEAQAEIWNRIGPASYRRAILGPAHLVELGAYKVVCVRHPTPEAWAALLAANRGQRLILAVNRGTEFDRHNRARDFVRNPAISAELLPSVPFVESFQARVP